MSRSRPRQERWGPYPIVLLGAVLAVASTAVVGDPRWGGFALGVIMVLAALVRLSGGGGILAVRRRATDTLTLAVFGVALMGGAVALAWTELTSR
ncbi:DUF3017 domain-containing protein [Streptosporangium sandarakinum]|uniref:DUF3017 family protein n=1 Tax=Streptosporangium sandarakinum TaxID=1260955 RepID=A0A852UY63_9ACTN|nr:DUF3017 domain-containing protein [Streptosporangium sandarakinum]NYF39994.1 hypothetical protein [Streptosporangium sandarakinum]